jgi:hypothetical protein
MHRTNSVFVFDTFRSCAVGLVAGVAGWCLQQPRDAGVIARGLVAQISAVISGPLLTNQAPTFSQLMSYAWTATNFVSGAVFCAFFVTASVAVFLVLEWADRSANPRLQK